MSPEQSELQARLLELVRRLARPRNFRYYEALLETADFLEDSLSRLGYRVARQAYVEDGQRFENLYTLGAREPFTLIGAHYDSVFTCPGANDNGSGVACLLELARLLKDRDDFRFVCFVNEEPPFYRTQGMGSRRYLEALGGEAVREMICLETLGYYREEPGSQSSPLPGVLPDVGNFVAIVGDVQSAAVARRLVGAWQSRVPFPCLGLVPTEAGESLLRQAGMAMSDHANFWDWGIPAVMVTDTVFHRYPYYHENEDTWDKLTYEPFARVVWGLSQVLRAL